MSDDSHAFDADFARSMLQAAIDLATRLADTLVAERDVLVRRDLVPLRATVEEKDRLVEMLTQLERSRALVVSPADLASLTPDTARELGDLQNELKHHLLRCQEHNAVNGRLVQRARIAVDEVLATLTGVHRGGTYGASGASDNGSGSRVIGRA